MATVRPSIQPSSRRRRSKAATQSLQPENVLAPKKPIIGSLPDCCARAASGHAAAAPPSSVMNSRRFTAEYLPCLDRKDSTHGRKSAALELRLRRGLHHSTWFIVLCCFRSHRGE